MIRIILAGVLIAALSNLVPLGLFALALIGADRCASAGSTLVAALFALAAVVVAGAQAVSTIIRAKRKG